MKPFKTRILAAAVLLGIASTGIVVAQSSGATPAQQKELDAARADLERASRRVAELSLAYGGDGGMQIVRKRMARKPVIGVVLGPDEQAGVRIAGVTPGSPADQAGLKTGDRLLSVDGTPIAGDDGEARLKATRGLLSKTDARTPVRLRYSRGGREATVSATPRLDQHLLAWNDGDMQKMFPDGAGGFAFDHEHARGMSVMVAPEVRSEIIKLVPGSDCKGKDCKAPMLMEAFRWSGFNLASVDADLGRYFGTSQGVLVLSTGPELAGLQPGDVIQKIDGKAVASPREAMAALRAQPAGARVQVDYLRDRKPTSAQVKVPKAMPLRVPLPPEPPAPPAPPAVPSALAPPPHGMVEKRKVVIVDQDGKTRTWEGDADDPMPAWAEKAMPANAKRVEKRTRVVKDADGNVRTLDDAAAPPAPPTPPAPPPPPPPPSAD